MRSKIYARSVHFVLLVAIILHRVPLVNTVPLKEWAQQRRIVTLVIIVFSVQKWEILQF